MQHSQEVESRTGTVPVGLSGELEVLGEDTQSCKMNSIPKGRDSMPASRACKALTGAVRGSVTAVTMSGWPVSAWLQAQGVPGSSCKHTGALANLSGASQPAAPELQDLPQAVPDHCRA